MSLSDVAKAGGLGAVGHHAGGGERGEYQHRERDCAEGEG
jgi:hypothetical protein